MDSFLDELVNEVHVVLKRVFLLLWRSQVAAVTNDCFTDTAGFLGRIDAEFHLQQKDCHFWPGNRDGGELTFSAQTNRIRQREHEVEQANGRHYRSS